LAASIDLDAHLKEDGARRFRKDISPRELVEALLYDPVVNLNGVGAGYPAGGKTILPHEAEAALDIRLPYGADEDALLNEIEALLNEVAPEVSVVDVDCCPPARTPSDSAVARAMIASHELGSHPARVWPSAPWWAPYFLFERTLNLPFAVGGAGHAAGAHAADEYATVEGLREHMHQSLAFLHLFAAEGSR
jgi:acetylornithine deacetylase/succinyl-diaminopimelate desuccinylase-like protein